MLKVRSVAVRVRTNRSEGTDDHTEGTHNGSKGMDSRSKGTDNRIKGTHYGSKGTDSRVRAARSSACGAQVELLDERRELRVLALK